MGDPAPTKVAVPRTSASAFALIARPLSKGVPAPDLVDFYQQNSSVSIAQIEVGLSYGKLSIL